MDGGDTEASSESTFSMDPQAVLLELSRSLVQGQRMLGHFRRSAAKASGAHAGSEAYEEFAAQLKEYEKHWHEDQLPMLLASMQLAIEVYDTFGPGLSRVEDPTEAAIWNNKHFVWVNELSGRSDG